MDYDCRGLSQVSRYYEEIGDDLGRHERKLKLCTTAKRVHHHCSVATNTQADVHIAHLTWGRSP